MITSVFVRYLYLVAVVLAGFGFGSGVAAQPAVSIDDLFARSAGDNLKQVCQDVEQMTELSQRYIKEKGLKQALIDFPHPPWKRSANGLHMWGVTLSGMSWFDAGHPDLVGLDVSGMTDIEGRNWWELAVASALGTGDSNFSIVFPHPKTARAATGYHSCFLLEDQQRVLCAGAFEDR
jgi:hypothetical protein